MLRFNGEPFSFGRANSQAKSATLDAIAHFIIDASEKGN